MKALLMAIVMMGTVTFVTTSGVLAQERVLRVRIASDIVGMDPARLFGIENQTMCNHIYNGLTKYDYGRTNQLIPDLAERWEISPDGKVYTFYLRKGVRWHKGYGELTADDVKFSYERVLDPHTASKYRGEFRLVERFEAVDAYTVRITLKQKYAGFLHKVAAYNQGFVVSKKAMEKLAERYATEPIGTGPFIFESWSPKNQVVLGANKEYFEGPPKVDKIIFKLIFEETTAEIALQKGEIDIFYTLQTPEVVKRLEKTPGIQVYRTTMNHTTNLVLNPNHPPLADPKVRRAVAYALNLQALREVFFQGLKNPPNWVLTTNFAESATDLTAWEHDPQKAKELLQEAGYPRGFPVTVTTLALQPMDKVAVVLADDMRKVGLDVKIQVLERAAYLAARTAGTPQMVFTGVTGPPDPDQPLWNLLHSSSFPPGMNTARYSAIDELLEAAQVELDRQKQLQVYRNIQEKIREDVPVIPLYNDVVFAAAGDHVKGFVPDPQLTMFLYPVWLEKK
jgi:peptide/nickel transport system substrate-binding protein